MDSEKEFQEKMRQLGTLVGELDQMPGGGSKVAARELVQLLMEVHRSGLERIMELVFQAGYRSFRWGDYRSTWSGSDRPQPASSLFSPSR